VTEVVLNLPDRRIEVWAKTQMGTWIAQARARMTRALLAAAQQVDPGEIDRLFQERISKVTTETVMAVMDQQGIDHCKLCPARVGLMKKEGDLLCQVHGREIG
jgi:hypothetical protein